MNCFIVLDLFLYVCRLQLINFYFIFYIVCVREIKSFDFDLNFDGLIAFVLFQDKSSDVEKVKKMILDLIDWRSKLLTRKYTVVS